MTHGIPPRLPPFRQTRAPRAAPVIVQYKVVLHRSSFPVSRGGGLPSRLPNKFAGSAPRSFPKTGPPVLNLNDTLSIGGRLYTITPTLTPAGPAPSPVPLPVPVPVPLPAEPVVTGVFAADGKTPLTHALPGATVVILGQHFGTSRGQVVFDPAGRAAVTLWSDTRIEAAVPAIGDSVRRQSVAIHLPTAAHFLPVLPEFGIDAPAAQKR